MSAKICEATRASRQCSLPLGHNGDHSALIKLYPGGGKFSREWPQEPVVLVQECDRCDGCGWYEGGKTLQTTCEECNGTGIVK